MTIWIITGIMGFLVVAALFYLIYRLLGLGHGYSLQRGRRPMRRKEYGSTYTLHKGGHEKVKHLNLRTGRLQRGLRPRRRPLVNMDIS